MAHAESLHGGFHQGRTKKPTRHEQSSNKTSKSSETHSRKTLAEQEEGFWLLSELQQEVAREQESRHTEQGIASETYKYLAGENDLAVTVKPGRYPGTFELLEVEA